jgi:predicted nucleic acid-binding protein
VDERWIIDASPLIVLSKAGRADLMLEPGREVLVPRAVSDEVSRGPVDDPARLVLESGFGHPAVPAEVPERLLAWGLGRGETEVLALAMERAQSVAVVDDAAARRCARTFQVPIIGTLGIVVRARRQGRIDSAAEVLHSLRDAGLWLHDTVVSSVLDQLGEPW